jgi:hypothetical protein
MATVEEHYDRVLADVYSWMFGGFDAGIEKNTRFFEHHRIRPVGSGTAIDLGAGCGFQSIPLARAGFSVTAIDIDGTLLDELRVHADGLPIRTVQDDLLDFGRHREGLVELMVCMTDTILHLDREEQVVSLFDKAFSRLEQGGRFILTFRDLSTELKELDRFIPVKSDRNTIFTCFLEYEPQTVKVHDLVYRRDGDAWSFNKSYYKKLRLSKEWVDTRLTSAGFTLTESTVDGGLVTVIATRA